MLPAQSQTVKAAHARNDVRDLSLPLRRPHTANRASHAFGRWEVHSHSLQSGHSDRDIGPSHLFKADGDYALIVQLLDYPALSAARWQAEGIQHIELCFPSAYSVVRPFFKRSSYGPQPDLA